MSMCLQNKSSKSKEEFIMLNLNVFENAINTMS